MSKKIKIGIIWLVISMAIGGSGCSMKEKMSAEDRIVSEMEEKYGEKFEFDAWAWEHYGSEDKNAYVTCESLPEKRIVVEQREKADGGFSYSDDYMAYKYEDELKTKLEKVIKSVYQKAKVILMLDSSQFPETMGPKMTGQEIMQNEETVFSLYIIVNQAVDEDLKNEQLETLRQKFEDEKIRVNGDLFFTTDETAWASITEENYSEWDYREDWYEACCQFSMDKAYELYYADWR